LSKFVVEIRNEADAPPIFGGTRDGSTKESVEVKEGLVARHLGEGLVQLVGDGLEFFFFMNQFIAY